MKKALLLNAALFATSFVYAQNSLKQTLVQNTQDQISFKENVHRRATAANTTLIKDTLHYYLNKFYFKTATTSYSNFPFHISAAVTTSNITHVGSRFDVPAGETVTVTGLEAIAQMAEGGVNLSVPIHLYLCNLNAQGLPILPPIDTVKTSIGKIAGVHEIKSIGGNLLHGPKTMTTSFAILLRNVSGSSGDYARLLRTAGTTATNTTSNINTKCSDYENGQGYGFVRFDTTFYSTTNFSLAAGFGVGTAYEFVVAPRVEYEVQASQIVPSWVRVQGDTTAPEFVCARDTMLFTNTSSGFFEHRMYNLNQFYRKWNLYSPFPSFFSSAFASDSAITWHFDFYDNDAHADSRVFLPYVNNHSIKVVTDIAIEPLCFVANQFRARLKPMGALGKVAQHMFNQDFKVCLKWCNGDTVGIEKLNKYDNLKVYPNPSVDGKIVLSGLKGESAIEVCNLLGERILEGKTTATDFEIDLSKQPAGTYLLKISGTHEQTKTLKIIKQE